MNPCEDCKDQPPDFCKCTLIKKLDSNDNSAWSCQNIMHYGRYHLFSKRQARLSNVPNSAITLSNFYGGCLFFYWFYMWLRCKHCQNMRYLHACCRVHYNWHISH